MTVQIRPSPASAMNPQLTIDAQFNVALRTYITNMQIIQDLCLFVVLGVLLLLQLDSQTDSDPAPLQLSLHHINSAHTAYMTKAFTDVRSQPH